MGLAFTVVDISTVDDDGFATGTDCTDERGMLDFTVASRYTILVNAEAVLTADEETIKGANEATVVVQVLMNF